MKVGDLIKFRTGILGTIIDVSADFGGYALVFVSGGVTFSNPAHMNLKSLIKNSEVI
jgi:hypothetical protein